MACRRIFRRVPESLFDSACRSPEQLSAADSLGIVGMRERCVLLGGELSISGSSGPGTVVIVRIRRTSCHRGQLRRIHKNALVNVEQIRKLASISSQPWLITLTNGHEFIVSKRQARNVRDVLNW